MSSPDKNAPNFNSSADSLKAQYERGADKGLMLPYLAVKPVITGYSPSDDKVDLICRENSGGLIRYFRGQKPFKDIEKDLQSIINLYNQEANLLEETLIESQVHPDYILTILKIRKIAEDCIEAVNKGTGHSIGTKTTLDAYHAAHFELQQQKESWHFNAAATRFESALDDLHERRSWDVDKTGGVLDKKYLNGSTNAGFEIAQDTIFAQTRNPTLRN